VPTLRTAPGSASHKAFSNLTYSGDRIPWRKPFIRDRAFPATVRGPVDLLALRRLASSLACVIVGGLRSDMGSLPSAPANTHVGSGLSPDLGNSMIHRACYYVNNTMRAVRVGH